MRRLGQEGNNMDILTVALLVSSVLSRVIMSENPVEFRVQNLQFVRNLIVNDFVGAQMNLIGHGISDWVINGILPLDFNSVRIEETKRNQSFLLNIHRRSPWSELNVFVVDNNIVVPAWCQRNANYNVVLNWTPARLSLLQTAAFVGLKYKIELISNGSRTMIQSLCFYCAGGYAAIVKVGNITALNEQKHFSKAVLFIDYTTDFNGRALRVYAGSILPTLNKFALRPDGTYFPIGGFQAPLVVEIHRKLNFKMNITLVKAFGRSEPDGSYSGLIGKVQSGEAELGIGAIVTLDRFPAVDFMSSNSIQYIVFSTAIPTSTIKWQAVFKSMSLAAWAILLVICVCFILPTYMAVSMVHRRKVGPRTMAYDCFDFLGRTLLEQAGVERQMFPQPSGRFLIASWLYFSIILGTAYKSRLVSLMISPVNEIVPNTFEELAASDYKIYTHFAGGALAKLIQSTPSVTFRKIAKKMTLEKSMVKCIGFSLAPKTACISYRDNLNGEGNKNFTDRNGHIVYRKAPGTAFNLPVSVILPKGVVYKESVDKAVLHLIDTGMAQYFLDTEIKSSWVQGKNWAKSRNDSLLISVQSNYTLKFQNFIGVYLLWVASLLIASGVLMVERFGEIVKEKAMTSGPLLV